ncbi:MAG: trypsin-like peptidase domain-containing protein [Planctomycetaceae bacterium]
MSVSRSLLLLFVLIPSALGQSPDGLPDSPRVTPLVRVIHKAEPAIVALFQVHESGNILSGSGTIIHPSGLVLTNNHVVQKNDGFALIGSSLPSDQKPVRFAVIGRLPERDLAIVKLAGPGPFPVVPLGRSHDLLNGESVVVAGNPGGRGTVFTAGIISSRMVLAGAPNALVMTNYKDSRRPMFIQFDAASNGGNSGGPLINMEGHLVGIVSAKIYQEQNIGFAIPVDDLHNLAQDLLEPETLNRKVLGLTVAPSVSDVEVATVEAGAAAAQGGLQPGDRIVSLNGQTLRHRVDWYLLLRGLLKDGRKLVLGVRRGDQSLDLHVQPQDLTPMASVAVDESKLAPGLRYDVYRGRYSLVPEFESLTPVGSGVAQKVDLSAIDHGDDEYFAVRLTGFLKLSEDGLYRLLVRSDDGSKVEFHDAPTIDNDGNHPAQTVGRLLYLQKGLHPLCISYFQGNGLLELKFEVDHVDKGQVHDSFGMIWHETGEP